MIGRFPAGAIPLAWLNIADTWATHELFDLRREVDRRDVDETDLTAIMAIWDELSQLRTPDPEFTAGMLVGGLAALIELARDCRMAIKGQWGPDHPATKVLLGRLDAFLGPD